MASLSVVVQRFSGDLRCAKADGATVVLRTEFGKRTANDSQEYIVLPNSSTEASYSATFDVATETLTSIEEVANNRVVVSFLEVSKGDKKKKGDTITPLGSAELDLLPLLQNTTEFTTTCTLSLVTPGDDTAGRPTLDARVTLSRPLLSAAQIEHGNLLTISVAGLFALPDSWCSSATPAPTFSLSLPVPSSLDADRTVTMAGGVVAPPRPLDDVTDLDESDGDFRAPDDAAFRRDAMSRKPAVRFPNSNLRVFLGQDALQRLLQRLPATRVLPVEIKRIGPPGAAKGAKGKKSDDDDTLYHGVSFVSATPLLYPGTSSVHGAYMLRPYSESEVAERMRQAGPDETKTAKGPRKARSALPDSDDAPSDSRMFVNIALTLSRPLVARRVAASLAAQVSELIPPRPSLPRVGGSEARAVAEYETQVASVASMLIDEYRRAAADEDPRAGDQIRNKLVYELNSTGKYHAIKEQLKQSIIKVVREKFLQVSSIANPAERHAFLTHLYVFLGQHMRTSLSTFFSFAQPEPAAPSLLQASETIAGVAPAQRLLHAAHEAEVLEDPARAAAVYQDLVTRYRSDVNAWCAYGSFACRAGDRDRASLCFREALALSQTHLPALLAAAALAALADQDQEAHVLFEAATVMHPDSGLAWIARALYYDGLDNDIGKSMCLLEARKTPHGASGQSLYLAAADHYTSLGLVELAQRALAHEALTPTPAMCLARARMLLASRPRPVDELVLAVEQALETDHHRAELWAILGTALQHTDIARAIDSLRHSLDLPEPAVPNPDTMLLLAGLHLRRGDFADARELYLRYCHAAPSAAGWEGLGVACFRLGQHQDAREALAESNAHDNLNPQVWAYLSLVSIKLSQPLDAQQAFKFATKLGLRAGPLLDELTAAQTAAGFGNPFEPSLPSA